jgi:pimeloyl-ACP methyl ester carboxylesterase/UDP:flavonoid glycosyltransferase YjiC (YdhE family)
MYLKEQTMYAENKDVKIWYEIHGEGEPVLIMVPGLQIMHSEGFKRYYVPFLSRHMRVVTIDLRGSGKSDRPDEGYDLKSYTEDIRAVVEDAGLRRFAMAGLSGGAPTCIQYYANYPDHVSHLILLNGFAKMIRSEAYPQGVPAETLKGALKIWHDQPEDMLKGFIELVYSEKYTLRGKELVWQWAHETLPEFWAKGFSTFVSLNVGEYLDNMDLPVQIIVSENDQIVLPSASDYLHQEITHSELTIISDAGHGFAHTWPQVGRIIRDFLSPVSRVSVSEKKQKDAPRILCISSPIGLGHVKRDLSIADEMRKQMPGMIIDWLAIDPVKSCLESFGEHIHPLSNALRDESGHFESHADAYSLNATEAYWEMDRLLANNFMVFYDAVRENHYDLVVGDEIWEVAEYLHYNPSLKTAPFVFMSDFIGMTNVSDDKAERAHVYNVNGTWIEMREIHPDAADLSIFVGEYDDIPDIPLGEGLPDRKKWAKDHFEPSGYILPFDPAAFSDREGIRADLGFLPEDKILLIAVGGTSVGRPLIEKCLDAHKRLHGKIPGLRTQVLCGPRLDPDSFSRCENVEFKPFVADPIKLFAASDLAIIQGGLSTAMELTALNRPFLYFPLKDHFEQQDFVPFRLNRYNAGFRMDFDTTSPEDIADAITENIGKSVNYHSVNTDGAKRAASMILGILNKGDS